jgi:hypothetical protein
MIDEPGYDKIISLVLLRFTEKNTSGGLLGSVTSKTSGTGCSDGTGNGLKVAGMMGGGMIGCVTEELGEVALADADDAGLELIADEIVSEEEGNPIDVAALEDIAELVARGTEADPCSVDVTGLLRELLVAARPTGRKESQRGLIVSCEKSTRAY